MDWYPNLYMGKKAAKKKEKLIREIENGEFRRDIVLITMASNPKNQLELISANQLQSELRRKKCGMIVGLAKGKEEALEVLQDMMEKTYAETNGANIREYLERSITIGV